uniref:Zinc finger, CCHC-type n=1 Tax=Tanacetum cinerariifolium TaxID=118510 RepID=A0A6L2JTI7_TANCI|nr:hypothetical protein [Tanacetum cinerariifolium]
MSGKDDKKIEAGTSKIIEIGSTTHFQCPMLKGANYTTWTIRMQVILEANGLCEMIEPNLTTEADTKKDKTAIAYIYQSLPEEQLLLISKYKTANIVNKAASLGLTYEDSVVVRKLLNVVPDKFLQIVASIEQYSNLDEMSVDEAIGRLKTFKERLKSKKEILVDNQESLMFTRHEGKEKPFRECGQGRFNQSRGQKQDKNNYQSKREERASFEEDTRDKSQVTWSAEIAESAETAGSAETTGV